MQGDIREYWGRSGGEDLLMYRKVAHLLNLTNFYYPLNRMKTYFSEDKNKQCYNIIII